MRVYIRFERNFGERKREMMVDYLIYLRTVIGLYQYILKVKNEIVHRGPAHCTSVGGAEIIEQFPRRRAVGRTYIIASVDRS